jgi:poly-gamma-glutamate system protein
VKPFIRRAAFIKLRPLTAAIMLMTALLGVAGTLFSKTTTILPYADIQLAASERMARAQKAILQIIQRENIQIEVEDVNLTGLIGPEWTELTSSIGVLEAKRTALQPDFAALMVKFYVHAGLKAGNIVCCGMSGSFPGLGLAAIAAANEMGLTIKVIPSYSSSMYGATRPELSIVRILEIAAQSGELTYELIAASPGGDFDRGSGNAFFPDSYERIQALARQDKVALIDQERFSDNIQERLRLFGPEVDCFVNIGGASANVGERSIYLAFPNGLTMNPPRIPTEEDRGLMFEYSARGVPVIHLLNIRGLAEKNGLPYDPVPLTAPGQTGVFYQTRHASWPSITALITLAAIVILSRKRG